MLNIFAVAPSTVKVGERFSIGVKICTHPYFVGASCYMHSHPVKSPFNSSPRGIIYMDNVPPEWQGTIEIRGGEDYNGPERFVFDGKTSPFPGDRRPIARIEGLSFSRPGTKFIEIIETGSGNTFVSNPIRVSPGEPEERLFWADLHCQTFFSDGLRCPEELYRFARDEAFLDVFALSDHSEALTDRQWDYFTAVTNDFNCPGRFVTLVGQEWTSGKWGHRNAYFPGDYGPIWRCLDPKFSDLEDLYAAAREYGALLIPHHSANEEMGINWDNGHDPEVERLVEIYSIWGNSERPAREGNPRPIRVNGGERDGRHVVDALRRGYRFGIVGGGDIHDGRPGDELHTLQRRPESYRRLWRQGITGIWARKLTREAIFEALWNRRVFATTNVRIFLKFSADGSPMGSEVKANNEVHFLLEIASEVPIARIDLVKNGDDLHTEYPNVRELVRDFSDDPEDGDWYYVRVTRIDGEMAWSSPIWIKR
ncbi:CehA/McbA family metallohydrolase [Candidatus Poribacteria bacterium]|nr:CehA/McbA family metallohydrolase [Candidatus Poribacteria bacterium]